ncbi:MAG TPA: hydroxymethylbilane synthase [Acidimicrobiales bacterium]|nr:hydroxymethylbilane synthase [Acidimicrobiales bacterium]
MARPLRAATRGSPLALWQTRRVAALLTAAGGPGVEEVVVETTGDRRRDAPIHLIGGQGAFVKEVQAAVLEGRADFAVHSAKDLPPRCPAGLVLACVPERADPRDALVGAGLDDLAAGAQVATGSVRRRAQLAWLRPDLTFAGLRGNIDTRLAAASRHDAVVVAVAALDRLGRRGEVAEVLAPAVMLPQVAQGALAVECRSDDTGVVETLARLDDPVARAAVDAERGFLDQLGGSCDLPVGALASVSGAELEIEAMVASLDGRALIRRRAGGPAAQADSVGRELARALAGSGAVGLLTEEAGASWGGSGGGAR